MSARSAALVDQWGATLPPSSNNTGVIRTQAFGGQVDGRWYGGGMYDALNFSPARAVRPFFATDSKFTLTSWNRLRAMALTRWAYINVPYVRGAVDLFARLCVGTGFTSHSLSSNKNWGRFADAYVGSKMRSIGFANGESMDDLLLHDCRGMDVDGDLGYAMTEDEYQQPKLQLMEGHRIKSGNVSDPQCIDGVWFDQYARRTHYNVLLPGESENTRRIAVQNFIYLAERNRPDEPRSMTNLIHALNPLQDLYEIVAFETASVKKNSELGLTVETPTPDRPPGLGPPIIDFVGDGVAASGDQPAQPRQYATREMVYGGGGKIAVLAKGETLKQHEHTRPDPCIEAWAEFIIRGIAVGFGLPFEVLWNPETIGGANTRLITSLLRARLEQRRESTIFPKLVRVRYWILARGVMRGEIPYDPEMWKVEFLPNFVDVTVDAGRESRERRANVLQGLDTFTSYFAEDGKSYGDQLKVRTEEITAQCEAAQALAKAFPWMTEAQALARIAMLTPNANEATAAKGADEPKDTAKK